jgi:hypothetical protein
VRFLLGTVCILIVVFLPGGLVGTAVRWPADRAPAPRGSGVHDPALTEFQEEA